MQFVKKLKIFLTKFKHTLYYYQPPFNSIHLSNLFHKFVVELINHVTKLPHVRTIVKSNHATYEKDMTNVFKLTVD